MSRFIFFLIGACLISMQGKGQFLLKGKILDAETNEPLPLASIYLNNTTIGASSDLEGNFQLRIPTGNYDAVISFTGYQSILYKVPTSAPESALVFKLNPEEIELDEIRVSSKRDPSWYNNLAVFKKNFLGESSEARKTTISNEERLIIDFESTKRELLVMSREPLQISNEALGYELSYRLENFFYDMRQGLVSYAGYPFYREMEGNDRQKRRWDRARKDVYEGSFMHFARVLIAGGNPKEQGFEVRPIKPQYKVSGQKPNPGVVLNQQEVTIDSLLQPYNYFIKTDDNRYFFIFEDKIEISYSKKRPDYYYTVGPMNRREGIRISTLNLQQVPAELDLTGSFINPLAAVFGGYWGWEKIGNMLPLDYQIEYEE